MNEKLDWKPTAKQREFLADDSSRVYYLNRRYFRMPIDKPYAYHKPSPEGLAKITRLREHFSEGERLIKELCGGRQAAIAITNNEQTAMWAIKAVVFNDPNSEVDPA